MILLYTSISLSAFLIFLVQPLFARLLLPLLGGSASVWTASMLFFQIALLGGYLYTHLLQKVKNHRQQAFIHSLFIASVLLLGLPALSITDSPSPNAPLLWLLTTACLSVGLPFVLLASNSTLLQAWSSDSSSFSARNPYKLYVLSNVASFIGLFSYPIVLEPIASQAHIVDWFNYAMYLFIIISSALTLKVFFSSVESKNDTVLDTAPAPTWRNYFIWVSIAFLPNALVLSITTRTSTDIAPFPLLWVIPLSLYLLSFLWGFSERSWQRGITYSIGLLALASFAYCTAPSQAIVDIFIEYSTLWVVSVTCHRALYRRRPSPRYLSSFYLTLALGGVCAGAWCTIVAPFIFQFAVIEYPIALLIAMFLSLKEHSSYSPLSKKQNTFVIGSAFVFAIIVLWQAKLDWISTMLGESGTILGGCLIIIGLMSLAQKKAIVLMVLFSICSLGVHKSIARETILHSSRNFYGYLRVTEPNKSVRIMVHGSTIHGGQLKIPGKELEPLFYYYKEGPLGAVFEALPESASSHRLGIVGLGTGVISTYSKGFVGTDYYEIDPDVEKVAKNYFTFLSSSPSPVKVILGDGRIQLKNTADKTYSLLLLDAFSSDAIPTHLLTHEAFNLYRSKLTEDGELVVHITNRYLHLAPIVARIAEEIGMTTLHKMHVPPPGVPFSIQACEWMLLTNSEKRIKQLTDKDWQVRKSTSAPLWTDNYTSIFPLIRWMRR